MVKRHLAMVLLSLLSGSGCTTMAALSNLDTSECRNSFTEQMASVLSEQGETPDNSARLAERTASALATGEYGPRPFRVASSTGADYFFFLQRKGDACLLRLYGRRKGFVTYTNNLTYITTKPLAACICVE